jgi:hypothetical protein
LELARGHRARHREEVSMTIWAIGRVGERQRSTVETTDPAHVLVQMEPGEVCAPISRLQADSEAGVRLLGNMEVEDFTAESSDA